MAMLFLSRRRDVWRLASGVWRLASGPAAWATSLTRTHAGGVRQAVTVRQANPAIIGTMELTTLNFIQSLAHTMWRLDYAESESERERERERESERERETERALETELLIKAMWHSTAQLRALDKEKTPQPARGSVREGKARLLRRSGTLHLRFNLPFTSSSALSLDVSSPPPPAAPARCSFPVYYTTTL
ncbi:hypothetical protein IWZ03DRAFT_72758 [Phyllosticta citriasiana]|uniref:Uncharacterized protein n=1 Tax=Phyllosticta citriasiana TaxID=595635 RepID=A0ABR1KD25_9PEZI